MTKAGVDHRQTIEFIAYVTQLGFEPVHSGLHNAEAALEVFWDFEGEIMRFGHRPAINLCDWIKYVGPMASLSTRPGDRGGAVATHAGDRV